jgi:hypothetical protein
MGFGIRNDSLDAPARGMAADFTTTGLSFAVFPSGPANGGIGSVEQRCGGVGTGPMHERTFSIHLAIYLRGV